MSRSIQAKRQAFARLRDRFDRLGQSETFSIRVLVKSEPPEASHVQNVDEIDGWETLRRCEATSGGKYRCCDVEAVGSDDAIERWVNIAELAGDELSRWQIQAKDSGYGGVPGWADSMINAASNGWLTLPIRYDFFGGKIEHGVPPYQHPKVCDDPITASVLWSDWLANNDWPLSVEWLQNRKTDLADVLDRIANSLMADRTKEIRSVVHWALNGSPGVPSPIMDFYDSLPVDLQDCCSNVWRLCETSKNPLVIESPQQREHVVNQIRRLAVYFRNETPRQHPPNPEAVNPTITLLTRPKGKRPGPNANLELLKPFLDWDDAIFDYCDGSKVTPGKFWGDKSENAANKRKDIHEIAGVDGGLTEYKKIHHRVKARRKRLGEKINSVSEKIH